MPPPPSTSSEDLLPTLKASYLTYLSAQDYSDIPSVEAHLSPSCSQIARQNPAWNLSNRAEIMQALTRSGAFAARTAERARGKVEMRALTPEERATLPEGERERAEREGWEGMRVVLEDAELTGRRVVVNYYWRREEGRWVQCLHDLLWVGPRAEGGEDVGEVVFGRKGGEE
ncbi:hypothetical protein MMC15_007414 [Xylographa vitiligo]|nr:hypothetical protein [Xylographa vitiligo]